MQSLTGMLWSQSSMNCIEKRWQIGKSGDCGDGLEVHGKVHKTRNNS